MTAGTCLELSRQPCDARNRDHWSTTMGDTVSGNCRTAAEATRTKKPALRARQARLQKKAGPVRARL